MSLFEELVDQIRAESETPVGAADRLISELTDGELLGLLDGDLGFWAGIVDMGRNGYNHAPIVAGQVPRLGVPGIRFTDGPRGVVMGRSTSFPVAMARGATWDVNLEAEVGRAIGVEGRAQGANLFAGVCVNLLRHPAWGRAQETYGEDPFHVGAMGAAVTSGVRGHLMACVKHFALNSIESSRFLVDVTVDDAALHEVYLPQFRAVIDAGAESVMSAYNSVNGHWCGDDPRLLTETLRKRWGFEGFVMSDFVFGHRDPVGSVAAGLDLEMPFRQQRRDALPRALADGRLHRADVVRSARRLLSAQLRYSADLAQPTPPISAVASGAHRRLARRVAAQSMVLLTNRITSGSSVLPLNSDRLHSVVLIGPLASMDNLGDVGSSKVQPPCTATILNGLTDRFGDRVSFDRGEDLDRAVSAAAAADAAVLVVGYGPKDEGEAIIAPFGDALDTFPRPVRGPIKYVVRSIASALESRRKVPGGDRRTLTLRPHDEALIRRVSAVNERTIVVLIAGSAVLCEAWKEYPAAILVAWYPGMVGGNAVADVLCGLAEPGGRLPFAIPCSSEHLPPFERITTQIRYDRWWGQRLLDREHNEAAFPLGFGLGYTEFSVESAALRELTSTDADTEVFIDVRASNVGARLGATIIQAYGSAPESAEPQRRELIGFARVELGPGESSTVTLACGTGPLSRWDHRRRELVPPTGSLKIEVGQSWTDTAHILRLEMP